MSQSGPTETIRRAGTPPNAACLQQSAHDSPGRENREPQPIIRIYSGREITKIPEKNVFFQTIIHRQKKNTPLFESFALSMS